jgi:predicted transcriptional regulator
LSEESEKTKQTVSEATIREIAKRKTAVRILKYLLEQDGVRYTQEVADGLGIDEASADFYLKKLVSCDLIEEDKQQVDHRVRYYRILNRSVVEQVLEYFRKKTCEPKPEGKLRLTHQVEEV